MTWSWIITVIDPLTNETIECDIRHDMREAQRLYEYWKRLYEPQYKVTIGH